MKLDVDCKQKVIASSQMCLEFYKVMMGTFLVLFVPQDCGGSTCSVYDNIISDMLMRKVTIAFNSITFMSVVVLYVVEYRRELWCIENLDIDPSKSNEYLDDAIEEYPIIKQEMASYNNLYVDVFYIACGLMILNSLLSVIDIVQHDIAFPTFLSMFSFLLLVAGKLYDVHVITSASLDTERAFSSYMYIHRTFNTIDPDKLEKNGKEMNRI